MVKGERLLPSDVPGSCMFYPQVIQDPEGFYFGMDLDGMTMGTFRACISVMGLRELAKREGMLTPEEGSLKDAEIADLQQRLDMLDAENNDLQRQIDAIDGLVKDRGMVVRKLAGKKPQKVKEAA